jgi:hypothetical protein
LPHPLCRRTASPFRRSGVISSSVRRLGALRRRCLCRYTWRVSIGARRHPG